MSVHTLPTVLQITNGTLGMEKEIQQLTAANTFSETFFFFYMIVGLKKQIQRVSVPIGSLLQLQHDRQWVIMAL